MEMRRKRLATYYIYGSILLAFNIFVLNSSGLLSFILDPQSLLNIIGVMVPAVFMIYGWKKTWFYWTLPFKEEGSKSELLKGVDFYTTINSLLIVNCIFWTIIQIVGVLARLDTIEMIGPFLAVTFITILYALTIAIFFVIPRRNILKQRLIDLKLP